MNLKENLNLYDLTDDMMSEEKMQRVRAAERVCGCACYYANTPGGSSIEDNCDKNYDGGENGLCSPHPTRCFKSEGMDDRVVY